MNSTNFNVNGIIQKNDADLILNDRLSDKKSMIDFLSKTVAGILKISSSNIITELPFLEYGLRGSAVQAYVKQINDNLNIDLKAIELFSYPNISALADLIVEKYILKKEKTDEFVSEFSTPLKTEPDHNKDLIAVIGMSGKFGSANSVDEFFEVLKNGKSLIRAVPENRWSIDEYYTTDRNDAQKSYSKWGSFLENIDQFDPAFFRISGRDAEVMDPQQRLFLEETWKALEDAGIDPDVLKTLRCGVFATSGLSDYIGTEAEEASSWWGNDPAVFAARMSYFLDTKGPAIAVDTACSSSLTAIHLACNSLMSGESSVAIAGGAWIETRHHFYRKASRAQMLSPEGKCYAFDSRANGFVPGEAVGVLILKRLEDAEKDADQIHAVIRGTYTNQDGSTNGITAPNGKAQQNLLTEAFQKFKINPESIGCVEAHGTGTRLGDPIEFGALDAAFKNFTAEKNFCSLGSVKTNMGHSVMAAGVSGVIKMILTIKNKSLFPSLNFENPNALIDVENSPFKIQKSLEFWKQKTDDPRRATVSGFGFSGTNVVTIVEEYKKVEKKYENRGAALIPLSAKTEKQLLDYCEKLRLHLEQNPETDLYDLAYTLQLGRKTMEKKQFIIAENLEDLRQKLGQPVFYNDNTEEPIDPDKIVRAIENKNWKVLGKAWMNGHSIDWKALYAPEQCSKISLPGYCFERKSYWYTKENIINERKLHPLVHRNTSDFSQQQFKSILNDKESSISGHKVGEHVVFPGVAYLELARAAAELSQGKKITEVHQITWINPLEITKNTIAEVVINVKEKEDRILYEIESGDGEGKLKSTGKLGTTIHHPKFTDIISLQNNFNEYWEGEKCYEKFKEIGLNYGKGFQGINKLYLNNTEALAVINLAKSKEIRWTIGALDSALQCCVGLFLHNGGDELILPFRLEKAIFYDEIPENFYCHIKVESQNSSEKLENFTIRLIGHEGNMICELEGVVFAKVQQIISEKPVNSVKNNFSNGQERQIIPENKNTRELVTQQIRVFAADIVKFDISTIQADQDFMSYGFDSATLVKLSSDLNAYYDIHLTPALFYSYSSINELVDFLEENHADQLEKKYAKNKDHHHSEIQIPENKNLETPEISADFGGEDDNTVAIVGISGRFPGCDNLDDFWQKLYDNENMISEIPADRWDWRSFYGDPAIDSSKTKAKWGGFISDIDKFDALFFGISPAEAALMDPQQRIFMEAVYTALEDGGIAYSDLKGSDTGVFVGTWTNDYEMLLQENEDLYLQGLIPSGTVHSILANRISYLLDLHGPSEPIDTACSSSLIAIHRAVEHIHSGRCKMAIAGGVNAILSPETSLYISNANMLSEDGNCKPFDASANGYVRSEGVGVVILKNLKDAERDGDHIYAIICGTAENHGGRANTLTSPNPLAQAELLFEAYQSAGVDPSSVSYIETHGTGTSLGDPIETEGLKMAFDRLYKERGLNISEKTCSIGSVKANIGHMESASGMAGIIKVLLAMKHKVLPGNPLLSKPNPYLRLEGSPFHLQKETEIWTTSDSRPRIAGISSFGFSGVNAHIILEEYRKKETSQRAYTGKMMIPLSAQNKDRLQQKAKDLIHYLNHHPDTDFLSIAYTLQVGREPMHEKAAFLAENNHELKRQLECFLRNEMNDHIVNPSQETSSINEFHTADLLFSDLNISELKKLAQSWVNGTKIDWLKLYKDEIPHKIQLPTYPFNRKRHWFSAEKKMKETVQSFSHPILGQDYSTEALIDFEFKFKGDEKYLEDHKVDGKVLFPGAAYLEVVFAAVRNSNQQKNIQLKNCSWISPLFSKGEEQVLHLQIDKNSGEYRVKSNTDLYSKGAVNFTHEISQPLSQNISKIISNLRFHKTGKEYYEILHENGLQYGSGYQGIQKIYYDKGVALAEISLDAGQDFIIAPPLVDSALQATIGTLLIDKMETLLVPAGVKYINIYNTLPDKIWSYVRRNPTHDEVYSFDITITDPSGNVLIELIELMVNPLIKKEKNVKAQDNIYTRIYDYSWQKSSPQNNTAEKKDFQHLFVLDSISQNFVNLLETNLNSIVTVLPNQEKEELFIAILNKLKTIRKGRILFLYDNKDEHKYGYLSGLLKTLRLENPYMSGSLLSVDGLLSESRSYDIVESIKKETLNDEVEIKITGNERLIKKLVPFSTDKMLPPIAKVGGVYVITGGAGGLGKIFSEYLAETKDTEIIIVGRKPENEVTITKSNIHYVSCDIASRENVAGLIQKIKFRFGKITGIIHGAGVIHDSYIAGKTEEEIKKVFAPKVHGLTHLDEETKNENLDSFILCSSIASVAGNIGQADYASANAWMDNFAAHRNKMEQNGLRKGVCRSINWPLWEDGGMHIDQNTANILEKKWGMLPMPTSEGIAAMEAMLHHKVDQAVVVYGNKEFLPEGEKMQQETSSADKPSNGALPVLAKKEAGEYILNLIAEILDYDKEELSTDAELRSYGFSSYLLVRFSNELNTFYDINEPPSIFYNYPTINDLVDFLWENHQEKLVIKHRKNTDQDLKIESADFRADTVDFNEIDSLSEENSENEIDTDEELENSVAIVGIAGRFPGAENVDEFWNLLKNNEDAITEIPEERWNWKEYYGNSAENIRKTQVKWGGFINDVDQFDAEYFGITPNEATLMDPQQRITIETVYTALEDANITPSSLKGSNTGVFIGVMNNDYAVMLRRNPELGRQPHAGIGNSDAMLANRISFLLDINGPSVPVKTACSSSLIAIHRAAEKIRNGKCDHAIAGGVNTVLISDTTLMINNAGMLSQDGRCRSFDDRANGYVRSEGVGIVILKSFKKAKQDGDFIYGLIRGGAENHGGKANSLTAPNPKSQRDLLIEAYRKFNIDPSRISYIEAHGTGTALGDPIEIEGLKMAFETLYKENDKKIIPSGCAVGSVKANIGHTESASGVAGLIKVLMAFKHKTLPGNPQLINPNPYLQTEGSHFYLLSETIPWNSDHAKMAGISSFGFGGANAHLIVQEYHNTHQKIDHTGSAVILLTAKNKERLTEYAKLLKEKIVSNSSLNIHSIALTLQSGRDFLEERVGWIAEDLNDLLYQINAYLEGEEPAFSGNILQGKASLKILNEAVDENEKIRMIAESNFRSLLNLWCVGADIPWDLLYGDSKPDRIKLPTYPFERKRFWIPDLKNEVKSTLRAPEKESQNIENRIQKIVADIVKKPVETMNIKSDFFEFGLDSVSGWELIRSINKQLDIRMDFHVLYDYTTIESLAAFVEKEMMMNKAVN
ncbi:SDR family NAD(P)-dependent oxidoreductase [Chryseobacterium sp. BIGb0232]|uniref:SDR family NAD(P)-dependent oxidoreductase n=1 Tax=Chryseobacterium sp. BIGb0232 TaxID=2940598 RepID=UPI000F4A90C0|nr:SDR family NAD(P)-dependent oxidoreductase [Chryseobacterium sp. BIGb0232]MCS4300931.1 acyl transferase domain-containing protein [Chryseobacterium sp. BIGb0232]ROS20201.1 acyl transferase domain-containing protein [Chryseobacterium nakagawai]